MKKMHRPWIPVFPSIGIALVVAMLGWLGTPAGAEPAGVAADGRTVAMATVNGAVSSSGGQSEAVIFSGQASISGKVIPDPDFGAPPILEIVIDLSNVSGTGVRSGKTYLVSTQAVLHRPLLAFDSIELSFPFIAEGDDMLRARSALASFSIQFSAARGITPTKVNITANRSGR